MDAAECSDVPQAEMAADGMSVIAPLSDVDRAGKRLATTTCGSE
jgi:hypothetical protein